MARPAKPRTFIAPDDVETMLLEWGTIKWLCTPPITGGERIAAGVVVLNPGKGHARHNHPTSDEVLYYLSGIGEQMIEDAQGKPVSRSAAPGEAVHIPQGVFHSTLNTGWEPMRFLAVYSPAGPEQLLKDLPDFIETLAPGKIPKR